MVAVDKVALFLLLKRLELILSFNLDQEKEAGVEPGKGTGQGADNRVPNLEANSLFKTW